MKNLNIGIVGAGQMGVDIAALFASFDVPVVLVDVLSEALTQAEAKINTLVASNKVSKTTKKNITYSSVISDLSKCSFVLEAVSENLGIKQSVYQSLSGVLCSDAVLATNTSSFLITQLAQHYAYPSQFIGVHFMNPALKMPLVEVILAEKTSEAADDFVVQLMQRVEKTAIKVKDSPGFVVNKLLLPMINEAFNLLHKNIATAEDIDKAMVLGASFPMGPLKLADFIGLDTCLAIMQTLDKECVERGYVPSVLLKDYVRQGRLGRKTRQGVYSY